MNAAEIKIGVLRQDIELISGQENMIFDPVADSYFKVSAQALKIMSFMTEILPVSGFIDKLEKNGVSAKKEEVLELYLFLKTSNLIIPEYGEAAARCKREQEQKEKSRFLRFSAAYLFFRLPPWRPEKFFKKIAPFVSFWASKWMLILSAIPAVIGYLLVLKNLSLVKTTFVNSITWAGLVKYFLVIIILKFIHEAAHSIAAIHFNC
ncbi:MAG: hypothetical protein J6R86_05170, partial [Lentisphaeria bacterium]|nr:hypothetical protein [Lentisphaeria bacterium]